MQDIDIPQNRVIIIGGDHHNGLGLARIFGLNGKKVSAIIISNKKRSWMATSKFIEFHKIFKTEKEAFDYILENYSAEPLKPVLIPYSDGAAMDLDLRLNQFKDCFYVPSINGEQGRIASLMDKDAQYKWAQDHGIKMAESAVVDFSQKQDFESIFTSFPCIVKPNNSAESKKSDIRICESSSELSETLDLYVKLKYSSAIIQQYLSIDYEVDVLGGISFKGISSIFPHKILRRWPEKRGTSSFTCVIVDENVVSFSKSVLSSLAKDGLVGLYDVEIFKVGTDFYLNEINFRNSGSGFRTISQRFFYAVKWLKEIVGNSYEECILPKEETYSMTEYTDVRHVMTRKVGLAQFLKDVIKCKNFALFFAKDKKPFIFKFINAVNR